MKTTTLFFALAIALPALAQEPTPAEQAAPAKSAEEAPGTPAGDPPAKPAEDKQDGAAAKPDPKPPGDLPPLPEPAPGSEQEDILRNSPGGRLKPAPVPVPGAERNTNRSTLKPPMTSEDLERRIRYREARTKAEADPKLKALWDESRKAATDYEKRELLKEYYRGLYAKMRAADKTFDPLLDARRRTAMRRLDQTRVEPTEPADESTRITRD